MKNGLVVDKNGNKRWYANDQLHREDGPAIEWAIGLQEWYFKNIFVGYGDHPNPELWARLTSTEVNGGPLLNGCIVFLRGDKFWYKDDKLHREDGPAVEFADGIKGWCLHGEYLGWNAEGFWKLWGRLTPEQRGNPTLLKYLPRCAGWRR